MIDPIGRLKAIAAYISTVDGKVDTINTNVDDIETATAKPEVIANIFDADIGYWTEVDGLGRVTIDYTDERIEIVDLDNDEDVYVYKATDANVTDFILDFEFQVLGTSTADASFGFGLADGIGTMKDVNSGLYVYIYHNGADDNWACIVHTTGGAFLLSDYIKTLLDTTTYYGRLIRRGLYCWLGIYSDRIRETHVTGSPVEYKDATPVAFTHLYPMTGSEDGVAGSEMDAYVEAVKLISAPDIDKYLRPGEGGTNAVLEAATAKPEIIANIFDIDMGYWTEVDVPGRVLIDYTNERIAITDLDNDEDVYVYKATDATVDDFILDFEFQVLNTATGAPCDFGIGLADGVGTMEDVSNGLYARIYHSGIDNGVIAIAHMTSGTLAQSDNIPSLLDDTTYYVRLIRRGSYCWLGIYSDRIRETHVAGSPIEYKDTTPNSFTHLYPMAGLDDGTAGKEMDAYVEAIKLISSPDIDKYLGRYVE